MPSRVPILHILDGNNTTQKVFTDENRALQRGFFIASTWVSHVHGAMELVKLRGQEQFNHPLKACFIS